MPIFDGFKISNDIKARKLDLQAATESLNKAKDDLSINIASYFVQVLYKRLRIQGYIVGDAQHLDQAFSEEMGGWLKAGKIKTFDTVHEGVENAPEAYAGLFIGANIGKTLVRLGPDPAI